MTKHTDIANALFPISKEPVNPEIIKALIEIKKSAALTYRELQVLSPEKSAAIIQACDKLVALPDTDFTQEFSIDVFQTGSGTNSNMNVNESIAQRSNTHPNNEVNYGQSSNDTFPSAIHIAALKNIQHQLIPALEALNNATKQKSAALETVVKTGRTHSMDAMPITFGQEIFAWHQTLADSLYSINQALPLLAQLPLGGTAVGTGINAHPQAAEKMCQHVSEHLNITLSHHPIPSSRMGSQHVLLNTSNSLTILATTLNKIASDLILLNSGPLCGLGDIRLPAHIDGSSIMPGKVNPVIPESTCQVYARVMGNHTTIQCGTSNSRLQLNVYLPVMGNALLNSIQILTNACQNLIKDIDGFEVNTDKINDTLNRNPIIITGLNKIIGYDLGKKIVQKSLQEQRSIIDIAEEMTDLSRPEIEKALDPLKLALNQNS